MATFDPKTYNHEAFEELFGKAAKKVQLFVDALVSDEEPSDLTDIEAGVVEAAATAVLGGWFELHRIADALETVAQPLADMIDEAHA